MFGQPDEGTPVAIFYREKQDRFELHSIDDIQNHNPNRRVTIVTREEVVRKTASLHPKVIAVMSEVLARVDRGAYTGEDVHIGQFGADPYTFTVRPSTGLDKVIADSAFKDAFTHSRIKMTLCSKDESVAEQHEAESARIAICKRRTKRISIGLWMVASIVGLMIWAEPGWKQSVCLVALFGSIQNLIEDNLKKRSLFGLRGDYLLSYVTGFCVGGYLLAMYAGKSWVGTAFGVALIVNDFLLYPWLLRKRDRLEKQIKRSRIHE